MTGQGGWPLTAFCDPEGVPFYGGTYFPPEPRQGMPSFPMVMEAVAKSWATQREQIAEMAGRVRDAARRRSAGIEPRPSEPRPGGGRERGEPAAHGGRHGARRLRRGAEVPARLGAGADARPSASPSPVEVTLDAMAAGGIYDQIGGGFARYSVDPIWLVPHFEKMLYDNALLARAYLHGYQALGVERWREVCGADARLGAARDARARGRLLLGARRRLRGRGGPLLRLDAGRDPRGARRGGPGGARRRGDRLLRGHRARQLRGPQHPQPDRPPRRAAPRPGSTRRARRSTRRARSACGRASTTSGSPRGTR